MAASGVEQVFQVAAHRLFELADYLHPGFRRLAAIHGGLVVQQTIEDRGDQRLIGTDGRHGGGNDQYLMAKCLMNDGVFLRHLVVVIRHSALVGLAALDPPYAAGGSANVISLSSMMLRPSSPTRIDPLTDAADRVRRAPPRQSVSRPRRNWSSAS